MTTGKLVQICASHSIVRAPAKNLKADMAVPTSMLHTVLTLMDVYLITG